MSRDNVRTTYFEIAKISGRFSENLDIANIPSPSAAGRAQRLHFTDLGEKSRNSQNLPFPRSGSFFMLVIDFSSNFHWIRTKIEDRSPHKAQAALA